MVLNREIKKCIKFCEREMSKWERRVLITSLVLFSAILGITIFQMWVSDWDMSLSNYELVDYIKYVLLSPILFYLNFSRIQYTSFKKEMHKHKLKLIELNSPKTYLNTYKSPVEGKKYKNVS